MGLDFGGVNFVFLISIGTQPRNEIIMMLYLKNKEIADIKLIVQSVDLKNI